MENLNTIKHSWEEWVDEAAHLANEVRHLGLKKVKEVEDFLKEHQTADDILQ